MALQKKIVHVLNGLDVVGGAEILVLELARKEKLTVYFRDSIISSVYNIENIELVPYKNSLVLSYLIASNRDYIWHFHLFPGVWLSLLSRHSVIHEHNSWNRRRKYGFLRWIEKVIYQKSDLILCISIAVKNELLSWLGSSSNLNAHVLDNFVPEIASIENNCAWSDFVLYPGSLTKQKGHERFLMEWAKTDLANKYHLIIAGDGELRLTLQDLVSDLGICNMVTFVGSVPLGAFYENCKVVILPSLWEGFGLVAVEAATFNKFTIGTDVKGLNVLLHPLLKLEQNYDSSDIQDKFTALNACIESEKDFLDVMRNKYCFSSFASNYNKLLNDNFNS